MKQGVYFMSEAGSCSRALGAERLGYEPVANNRNEVVLREGKRHEIHIAEDLKEMGYELEDAGPCLQCNEEFGREVSGHHVEISTVLIRLIGHVDRFLVIDGQRYPCEFKSMGLFIYGKFKSHGFDEFKGYEAQEACYTGFAQRPGLYVVKNRDNGEMTRYTVPYAGVALPGHPVLSISTNLEQIVEKLDLVEAYVRGGELPECRVPTSERRWCPFRYLCTEPEAEAEKLSEATQDSLVEAATLWKEGKELEKQAEQRINYAKEMFLSHAKNTPKFKVGGVIVSYLGTTTRRWLDEKALREIVDPKILANAQRESKPYENIRIKLSEE